MSKKLISLEEHNKNILESHNSLKTNGIACPNCGNELHDPSPNTVLTTYPPKKNIKCSSCDYSGYIYC